MSNLCLLSQCPFWKRLRATWDWMIELTLLSAGTSHGCHSAHTQMFERKWRKFDCDIILILGQNSCMGSAYTIKLLNWEPLHWSFVVINLYTAVKLLRCTLLLYRLQAEILFRTTWLWKIGSNCLMILENMEMTEEIKTIFFLFFLPTGFPFLSP